VDETKFSIITVSRNAAAHIGRCLESVAAQTYPHVEHVIIDGASTDGTQDIVASFSNRKGAFVSEPDGGIYQAMNKGLRLSTGDYILFLGADDYLADARVLADAAAFLERKGAPDWIYGDIEVRPLAAPANIFRPPPPESALDFMVCGCLPHQATFAHKRLFERIGGFDEGYRVHGDYDWFLRALTGEGVTVQYYNRVIASFALGGSSSQLEKGQEEVYAIQNALPLYRQPDWMERRLRAFQRATLGYRLQVESRQTQAAPLPFTDTKSRRKYVAAAHDLPVHFFTIVLNGEPFIRYHLDMMLKLPFRWHWHIVEGVAELVNDTAWSVAGGGRIDDSLHHAGRSNDGTSAYLDEIAALHPDKVTLYRKPPNVFWRGKKEMVAAPLQNVSGPCLLWQIDSDELWTDAQVIAVRDAFERSPERTAAFFWCHYFVGPGALISTRYNYAQNPDQDWLRVWRFQPGDTWLAHEPPTLVRDGKNLAQAAPFTQDEMEAVGAVFQHFAYVTPEQLRFKQVYYGYAGALDGWRALQTAVNASGPVLLRNHFSWVHDDTLVDGLSAVGVEPIAVELEGGAWRFNANTAARALAQRAEIVVDGVFFQHNQRSGIARVWRNLLREWSQSGFAQRIVVLDRAGTAPRLPGIRYRSIPAWSEHATGADAFLLQRMCDEHEARLFVSSYYTTPIHTPTVFVAHDMIPELLGLAQDAQAWREKGLAIAHAARFVCVSESTKADLLRAHAELEPGGVCVAHNAADADIAPSPTEALEAFRKKHRLEKPYLLLVGERVGLGGYKNAASFFRALQDWRRRDAYEIVCVGGAERIEAALIEAGPNVSARRLSLGDDELCAAYTGAEALVCPSRYEGFGLPVLEAMVCRCPVVAARTPALVEVGGAAAIYFDLDDDASLLCAIETAVDPAARERLVAAGVARAKAFSWTETAATYANLLSRTLDELKSGSLAPPPEALWRSVRGDQRAIQAALVRARAEGGVRRAAFVVEQGALRSSLFAVRAVLLRVLPDWAMPAARSVWRTLMGIKT
jgi:glycosyltransferase involved in cell wall biosynthesis/GT2 family glycosyltransferase